MMLMIKIAKFTFILCLLFRLGNYLFTAVFFFAAAENKLFQIAIHFALEIDYECFNAFSKWKREKKVCDILTLKLTFAYSKTFCSYK